MTNEIRYSASMTASEKREWKRNYMRARRLKARGKARPYVSLAGMTDEEKRQRRIAQAQAWHDAHPGYNTQWYAEAGGWRGYEKPRRDAAKLRAKHAVKNAIRTGVLTRGACVVCGDPNSQGHHADYSKPIDVVWLCRKHHDEEHRRINAEKAPEDLFG
jgi:hypothetical protein